jgi:hypothetical protein
MAHAIRCAASACGMVSSSSLRRSLNDDKVFTPAIPMDPSTSHNTNLEEVTRKGVLTGKAVGAQAIDGVEGGNDFKVREDAPSLPSEVHMSVEDIKQCLTSDEKLRNESSPVVVEVTRVIHGGGRSSGPMIPKPRAKGAQGSEDHLLPHLVLRPKPDAYRMYAQDQVVIHTAKM